MYNTLKGESAWTDNETNIMLRLVKTEKNKWSLAWMCFLWDAAHQLGTIQY